MPQGFTGLNQGHKFGPSPNALKRHIESWDLRIWRDGGWLVEFLSSFAEQTSQNMGGKQVQLIMLPLCLQAFLHLISKIANVIVI
ncbi:hypothetical protein Hdeb2414_s0005g00177531 [Helianthus debilis subsp. tardiflorus]